MALRFDTGDLAEPVRMDNGYLRADGRITRVGVFTYLLGNGKLRRELRPPDEVFNADAVGSFDIAPLTNDHPPEPLTAKNTRKYSVGAVSRVRRDGEFIRADVTIMDADAIDAAEGGRRELSCGYKCDLDPIGGMTDGIDGVPDGLQYDAVQRNIRGNHVALVDRGRAGRDATIRLDAEDGVVLHEEKPAGKPQNQKDPPMVKITIDGVDYEVTEQAAQAIAKEQARADSATDELKTARKAAEEQRARADKAEEELATEKKAREDAVSDETVKKAVAARLNLERAATKALGEKAAELKIDTLSDAEIKRAVILHVSPAAEEKLDGCSPEYLDARFDAALEVEPEKKADGDGEKPKPKPKLTRVPKTDNDSEDRFDADAARARMLKDNFERGRRALGAKAG